MGRHRCPILDLLKIDPETPLDVSTTEQLIIAPLKPSAAGRSLRRLRNGAQRYGKRSRSSPSEV